MTNKDAAKILYMQGSKQKEIAALLGVTEQTISGWKNEGDWEAKRTEQALQQETASERIWRLINHNLKVMENKIRKAEESGEMIQTDKGDVDALYKLFAAVKGGQETWGHFVRVTKELVKYLEMEDLELAKELYPHADAFLNERRKMLTS